MAEKRQGRHFHFSCFDGLEGHRLKAAALRRLKLRRSLEGCEQQKVALSLSQGTRAEGLWLRSFLPRLLCHHGPWQKGMHKLKFQRTALWNQDATFVGKLATGRKKSRITLLYYRLCCFSFIKPLSCYFKKWDRTIVSLPFTFRNARVDWLLSKQQVESTTHIHWEWQELEDATSWGHVWRPWTRGARWAFRQKMSPTKVIFSTKVVYFVDLDLALLNLISTYDIAKQMTIQEKQKNYTREKGIQEKKYMNVKWYCEHTQQQKQFVLVQV